MLVCRHNVIYFNVCYFISILIHKTIAHLHINIYTSYRLAEVSKFI